MAKSKNTDPQEARERIIEAYDADVCDSMHRQLRYAFGEPFVEGVDALKTWGGSRADDEITDYPDITMHSSEVGRSRSIIATQFNAAAKTLHAPPKPKYQQVDKMTNLIRQQFLMKRFSGSGQNNAHWGNEIEQMFLYGNGVGIGHLRLGLEQSEATGEHYVDIQHYSPFQCVLDRHDINKQRSTMVAFVDYLSKSKAYRIFGQTEADKWLSPRWAMGDAIHSGRGIRALNAMRVVHYFDLGFGDGNPTHICYPGSIHEKPLKVEDSDFWRILPHATYTHFQPPGMRNPVGQIILMMATQEMINFAERHLRSSLVTGRGIDLMDPTWFDDADAQAWKDGEFKTRFHMEGSPEKGEAFVRVPPMQVDQHVLMLLELFQRQFNTDSSQTSWDLNTPQADNRSATENMLLSQRSGSGAAWQKRQIANLYIDLFDKVGRIAATFDREPFMVDVNTFNILLNDPRDPSSWMDHWFAEPSDIVIDYAELSLDDVEAERERELMMLMSIAQIGMAINPVKYYYEVLKAAGKSPEEWMPPEMLQMAVAGMVPAAAGSTALGGMLAPMMGGGGGAVAPGDGGMASSGAPGADAKKALGGGPQPYAAPAY